ncbi:hypothetical protein NW752_007702 [Fusarium irregulare]|uniref:Uncharacterized protein n=1 Tax=Fusarium irregulare TaxID=2494466 RepID=A0A9W8U6H1_9HYPO|nr:hypothetical protein NW766_010002 [Fusarium irregulare]KAJ4013405.1 hypothetical protein NW752_007702 [Fusarium irregulare]
MDLRHNPNRPPKRQRIDEEGDAHFQANPSHHAPSWGQNYNPLAITSIQTQRLSNGTSTTPNATSIHTPWSTPSHCNNGWGSYYPHTHYTGHLATDIPSQNNLPLQWYSSVISTIPEPDPWLSHYSMLPAHIAPLQPHAPMHSTYYEQSLVPQTLSNQPNVSLQWPESYERQALSPFISGDSTQARLLVEEKDAGIAEAQDTTVCFGMVLGISARCEQKGATRQNLPTQFPVKLESSTRFIAESRTEIVGRIMSDHGQVLQGLLDETSLEFHASCAIDSSQAFELQKEPRALTTVPCTLEITIYGPMELFDELGSWLDDYQIFLQDPRECHRDVPYCNPHRLSLQDFSSAQLLSDAIARSPCALQLETVPQQPDLLDDLNSHEDLEEASQPSAIKRELRRHQKQALTFMLRRELGWEFDGGPNLWEIMDTDQGRLFLNRVSHASQSEVPPQCYGGIVADPMGLGKTLTMIALVATDLESSADVMDTDEGCHPDVPATLIVVPPPLMGTWEEQLTEHVVEGRLTYRRHHREDRLRSLDELKAFNIVLTTYHTISAEWSHSNSSKTSFIHSVRWKRIILDEAHLIRNGNSRMSQAICALDSRSRWAVTGTPLQNRLGDLATLFKFIRAYPYTDRRCFDADISHIWKVGQYQEAIKRLKRLSKCLLLRRDKGTVSLPARRDLQCPVDFNSEERALYNRLREKAIVSIDEAMSKDVDSSKTGSYVNVLQQIDSLRLVCNLGLHYDVRHGKSKRNPHAEYWTSLAQHTFNMQREMGPIDCLQCSSTLDITETELEDPTITPQRPLFFKCLSFICSDCAQRLNKTAKCTHNPSCISAPVSTSGQALESTLSDMLPQPERGLPSKIEALLADIKALPSGEKCIVFSTWRLTLDLVEAGLNQSSIPSVRFDGKVPQKDRQDIVERFRHDPSVRVMLLTLSCGAAGLTLTVATRAYLMEPHWNPTLEEQALARIHRIGQSREVTTVRFYVRDTFEQQVIKIQESKKYLAGLLLSPHDNGSASENLGRLQELISLI